MCPAAPHKPVGSGPERPFSDLLCGVSPRARAMNSASVNTVCCSFDIAGHSAEQHPRWSSFLPDPARMCPTPTRDTSRRAGGNGDGPGTWHRTWRRAAGARAADLGTARTRQPKRHNPTSPRRVAVTVTTHSCGCIGHSDQRGFDSQTQYEPNHTAVQRSAAHTNSAESLCIYQGAGTLAA